MADLHYHFLHRSPLLSIRDVCCRPRSAACGAEEQTTGTELVFPRAGLFVTHIGRQRIVADPTQVLFFNAGDVYRVSHPLFGGDQCTVLVFAPEILADALARYEPHREDPAESRFPATHGPIEPRTILFQQMLNRWLRGPDRDALATEELALRLLHAVVASTYRWRGTRSVRARPATRRAHQDWAEAARTFLAAHFRSPLSLAAVARAVHCSPYHLARIFRREVGVSLHQYLNRLRLGTALEHLAEGSAGLTQLAVELGYSSHSHFSDAFRREFGMSPSTFRGRATAAFLRELSKNLKA